MKKWIRREDSRFFLCLSPPFPSSIGEQDTLPVKKSPLHVADISSACDGDDEKALFHGCPWRRH